MWACVHVYLLCVVSLYTHLWLFVFSMYKDINMAICEGSYFSSFVYCSCTQLDDLNYATLVCCWPYMYICFMTLQCFTVMLAPDLAAYCITVHHLLTQLISKSWISVIFCSSEWHWSNSLICYFIHKFI